MRQSHRDPVFFGFKVQVTGVYLMGWGGQSLSAANKRKDSRGSGYPKGWVSAGVRTVVLEDRSFGRVLVWVIL